MIDSHRWMVCVNLWGEESKPRPYHGPDDDGVGTERTVDGTAWRGLGPTPEAAATHAHDGRTSALADVDETLGRLRTTLAAAAVLREAGEYLPGIDPALVRATRSLLGETKVSPDLEGVKRDQLRKWIGELERAVAGP